MALSVMIFWQIGAFIKSIGVNNFFGGALVSNNYLNTE